MRSTLILLAIAGLVLAGLAGTPAARTLVLSGSATPGFSLPVRVATAPVNAAAEGLVLSLVNKERAAKGLAALVVDAKVQNAARTYARELIAHGYLSHRSRTGSAPLDRVRAAGAAFRMVGENLAYAADVRRAHAGLMQSPGHRRNILFPQWRRIGIGVVDGGGQGVVVVQNFTD